MASIQFIDTGWLNSSRSGAQESSIVNSGTAVSLTNTTQTRLRWGANIESNPEPGTGQTVDTNLVSFENRRIDVDMVLKKTNSTHQEILKDIVGVVGDSSYPGALQTDGIKALYISGTSDSKKTLIELLGQTGTNFHSNEITSGLPAIFGYVENVTVDETGDNTSFRLKFTFIETNV